MQLQPTVKLIGEAPAFVKVVQQINGVASISAPVLVDGETGTGKELVARAIHYSGSRNAMPFIPTNCGALPETLIENEFFGHTRGAFTDAREPRPGLIAQAQGGTLFLDEVDALPLKGQVALLRFLQDMRYRPLGAARDEQADVRIVAATNVKLDELVAQRKFRPDLLYRLRIFSLTLPALSARPGDAVLLSKHFVRLFSKQYGSPEPAIADADLAWIDSHTWPGNVRELENFVHRAVVMSRGKPMMEFDFNHGEPAKQRAAIIQGPSQNYYAMGFKRAKAAVIRAFEKSFIEQALLEARGNVSAAARLSGKERRAFGKLMKKHGLTKRSSASGHHSESAS